MNINTNIDDYSVEDLLSILNIQDETPSQFQIKDESNKLISKLRNENKRDLVIFIEKARDKLLNNMNDENNDEYDDEDEDVFDEDNRDNIQNNEKTQLGNLWKNQFPAQINNDVESSKPTDRKQKVQIFDKEGKQNNAFVMNRERLGVLQSHPIPVVQGTINPNLKNLIKRIVCIDSQYRANIIPPSETAVNSINSPSFNTDFSCDLSERINNVISITLNSIQIPTSWYIFDDFLSNTCFIYKHEGDPDIFVKIPQGNYSLSFLNKYFATYTHNGSAIGSLHLLLTFDEVTGKLIFCTDLKDVSLLFYDEKFFNSCLESSCGVQMSINQNLGWFFGYRSVLQDKQESRLIVNLQYYNGYTPPPLPTNQQPPPKPPASGYIYYNIAQSPANLYGPTYFMLVLDDYNNNRVNNSLISITSVSNKLDLPSYYSPAVKNANNTFATVGCTNVLNDAEPALNIPLSNIPYMIRSSPRQLTQSQLYTANEILYNRTVYSNKTIGPSVADVLAVIPLNGIGNLRAKIAYDASGNAQLQNSQISQPYIVFGPQLLQAYQRTYFGPVSIEHLRVRLLDDRGNLVNLNGVDWSFTLLLEELYQY